MMNIQIFDFDPEKNAQLIKERCISFEEIISILEGVGPLDIIEHPNPSKYSHQKMYVLEVNEYIYLVPFVEDDKKIFLKTIFPSRKATKLYFDKER